MAHERDQQWERLWGLLAPMHDQALSSARALCRSSDEGNDLFQDTILRAFEKLDTLRDESRFRAWFYAVLLSRHRTRYRRRFWKRLLPLENELEEGREPAGHDGEREIESRAGAERAARALATLPAAQREAFVLHDLDGFTIAEVAEMQSKSISAVKSRLARGRERLRRYYRRLGLADEFASETNRSQSNREERDETAYSLKCARSSSG